MSGKCPEAIFDPFGHVDFGGYFALLGHCAPGREFFRSPDGRSIKVAMCAAIRALHFLAIANWKCGARGGVHVHAVLAEKGQ